MMPPRFSFHTDFIIKCECTIIRRKKRYGGKKVVTRVGLSFFFNFVANHPQEELAKFGYRSDWRVDYSLSSSF
jgi:hypothetical protein